MNIGTDRRVAIIGAGPGGLVAAKFLKTHGFEPTLFEQGRCLGGQWSGDVQHSGIWPSMHTNTSRIISCFSDMPHEEGTPVYPSGHQMGIYFTRYAEKHGLLAHVRTGTKVELIERESNLGLWHVTFRDVDGTKKVETYPFVVVASGRFNKPCMPSINGLSSFNGEVCHTFSYKDAGHYRGKRVLVCGGNISALEVASDLAMSGVEQVFVSSRRQRYVFQKLLAGVPTEHVVFTRFAALLGERMPMEVVAKGFKQLVTRTCGSPDQYGAPKPAENVFEAGITQSQYYLPLVAEGRIHPKPWVECFRGSIAEFSDGSSQSVDAVICGTGYELNLPFLGAELRKILNLNAQGIELYGHTFHPSLPGMAFLGQFDVAGPNIPLLELQARWITYVMSGVRPLPSQSEMEQAISVQRQKPRPAGQIPMHALAIRFARLAGVEPDIKSWPQLTRALMFGPLTAISFRLSGPDSLPEAVDQVISDAAAFGAMPTVDLSSEQREQLQLIGF